MTENTITNRSNGTLASCVGPNAVNAYRLKCIIIALEFKQKHGYEVSRFSTLKVAKQTTGLKTNKIDVQIAKLREMFNAELAKCEIRTEEK